MPWMVPETSLGPDQREVINTISQLWSNSWIRGHAGSGKSVLLVHLVRDYIAKYPEKTVCVVVFTKALQDMVRNGLTYLKIVAPVQTIYYFNNDTTAYDAIFCDEVQDIPVMFLEEMKSRAKTIIVAGDPEQSIYDMDPHFKKPPAHPSELVESLKAAEYPLTLIYRMTRSILKILGRIFGSILDGRPNVEKDDIEVKLCKANSFTQEIQYVFDESTRINRLRTSETVAILLPKHDYIINLCNSILKAGNNPEWVKLLNPWGKPDFGSLNTHLAEYSIPYQYIGNGYGSLANAEKTNKIILMTYHSAKGLDFNHVFLPMLSQNVEIHNGKEDVLLFVAISRSKYNLYITYTNDMYPPLKRFVQDINTLIIGEETNDNVDDDFVL